MLGGSLYTNIVNRSDSLSITVVFLLGNWFRWPGEGDRMTEWDGVIMGQNNIFSSIFHLIKK